MSHLGDCAIEAVGRHYSRVNSSTTRRGTSAPPKGSRLGDRVRALRVSAGLTQTDLAGDRFSKEYISQIERGKTRPTPETIGWLASRLGVDAAVLGSGGYRERRARGGG